jgi:hypothetical protein
MSWTLMRRLSAIDRRVAQWGRMMSALAPTPPASRPSPADVDRRLAQADEALDEAERQLAGGRCG